MSEESRRDIIRHNEMLRVRTMLNNLPPHKMYDRNERLALAKLGRESFHRGEWVTAASKRRMHPKEDPISFDPMPFDWCEEADEFDYNVL